MNGLFGVGPLELLVIGVLALIFIGPEKLPAVISQIMRTVRELRSYASQVQDELANELAPVREELQGFSREVTTATEEISQSANEVVAETQQVASAAATVPDLMAPPPPRDLTPQLPAPSGVHANGASRADEEERPAFADYRPQ